MQELLGIQIGLRCCCHKSAPLGLLEIMLLGPLAAANAIAATELFTKRIKGVVKLLTIRQEYFYKFLKLLLKFFLLVMHFSDDYCTDVKPRILLMGLRRSGKSSIQKVVFHKMSPNETLFLESTNKICRDDIANSSFVNFQIWDFPGQIDFFDPTFDYEMIFRGTGALIFVIDAQ
eukprot:g38028.t1